MLGGGSSRSSSSCATRGSQDHAVAAAGGALAAGRPRRPVSHRESRHRRFAPSERSWPFGWRPPGGATTWRRRSGRSGDGPIGGWTACIPSPAPSSRARRSAAMCARWRPLAAVAKAGRTFVALAEYPSRVPWRAPHARHLVDAVIYLEGTIVTTRRCSPQEPIRPTEEFVVLEISEDGLSRSPMIALLWSRSIHRAGSAITIALEGPVRWRSNPALGPPAVRSPRGPDGIDGTAPMRSRPRRQSGQPDGTTSRQVAGSSCSTSRAQDLAVATALAPLAPQRRARSHVLAASCAVGPLRPLRFERRMRMPRRWVRSDRDRPETRCIASSRGADRWSPRPIARGLSCPDETDLPGALSRLQVLMVSPAYGGPGCFMFRLLPPNCPVHRISGLIWSDQLIQSSRPAGTLAGFGRLLSSERGQRHRGRTGRLPDVDGLRLPALRYLAIPTSTTAALAGRSIASPRPRRQSARRCAIGSVCCWLLRRPPLCRRGWVGSVLPPVVAVPGARPAVGHDVQARRLLPPLRHPAVDATRWPLQPMSSTPAR